MALTHEQRRVAYHIYDVGRRKHASRRQILAALETGLVESHLTNPHHGDGTSIGWRQETASSYPGVNRLSVRGAAGRFFTEIQGAHGGTPGQMAQAVQRSAFPGRYDAVQGQAKDILHWLEKNYGSLKAGGGGGITIPGGEGVKLSHQSVFDKAGFEQAKRAAIVGSLIAKHRGTGGPLFKAGLLTTQQPDPSQFTTTHLLSKITHQKDTHLPGIDGGGGGKVTSAKGVKHFDGKPVAAWIYPILKYARAHGWKGSVESGFRSRAEQTRIYNSGVRPAAKPGTSNHEGSQFPRGAVDVSNAAQLASILRRSRYRHALVWAGGKDPVHFSHPHGGSY